MTWFRLHYMRYGAPGVSLHDSLDEAIASAATDVENNTASPTCIEDPDGKIAVSDMEMSDRVNEYWEKNG